VKPRPYPAYDFAAIKPGEAVVVDGTFRQVSAARDYYVRRHPELKRKLRVHNVIENADKAIIVRLA
jgi:hypothetical protein